MKIGLYSPYLDDMRGGEKYMLTLATCLAKNNDVTIFWDKSQYIRKVAQERFGINLDSITFSRNIFADSIPLISRLKATKQFNAIIILSDGSIPFTLAQKTILHFQFPVEWVLNSLKTKIKMKRITSVICNSEFTKKFIDKKFNIKSTVLYPPVTVRNKPTKKENIILHVGGFGKSAMGKSFKKQEILIDTFINMVNKGLKGWKLILIGSLREENKPFFDSLKKKAQGYPIYFEPNIDEKILWNYYNKAKIYWHASGYEEDLTVHPELAEHFGISTVEAMSAGAIPVVYNAGGQKEIVNNSENGYLWDSSDELLIKTEKIMNDLSLYKILSRNAQKKAKQFSKEVFCQQVQKLL